MFHSLRQIAAAGAVLSACAPPPAPVVHADPAAVERGRTLAQRACSGCHAVGPEDASVPGAPAFRDLGSRRDVIERTLTAAAAGHSMPPRWLTDSERRDVAAYIATLD
jgi:mono/diheme cytochrome c family protein